MTILPGMSNLQYDMTYKTDEITYKTSGDVTYRERNGIPRQRSLSDDAILSEQDASKVIDTCMRKDGIRYYKIRWKDSWEREDCLQGFDKLIRSFWEDLENKRNSERMDVANNNEISSPTFHSDTKSNSPTLHLTSKSPSPTLHLTSKSPSPTLHLTSGRRKGRPKKLINYNIDGFETNIEFADQHNKESFLHDIGKTRLPSFERKSESGTENCLSVHIPNREIVTKKEVKTNIVEEYPVMILHDNNEESTQISHGETSMTTSSSTHNYGSNASRFIDESKVKVAQTPPLKIQATSPRDFGRKRAFSYDESRDESKRRVHFGKSQIFMGRQFDQLGNQNHSSNHIPVLKFADSYKNQNVQNSFIDNHNKILTFKSRSPSHPLPLDRPPVIAHTERHLERITNSSQLLLTVTSMESISTPSIVKSELLNMKPSEKMTLISPQKNLEKSQEEKSKITKLGPKIKGPTLYQVTADGEQRPQCAECFQTFKKRAALERHMMIHRGIKPFQCHFCNQRFRQKHHLQGHIMLHTGERPHSCELCSKRFRMRHHLLEHERISHKLFR